MSGVNKKQCKMNTHTQNINVVNVLPSNQKVFAEKLWLFIANNGFVIICLMLNMNKITI